MALGRAYVEIVGDVSRFAPDLRRGLREALKIGALGTVAAAATSHLVGLAGAISSVGGVVVSVPAAVAVGVAALGALRVATAGLGDAFAAAASGDVKAFEKAVEGLSPRARELAGEVHRVAPALREVREAAQDAFAGPLVGQIGATVAMLRGPLREGLAGIAAYYGLAARRALEFVREAATVSEGYKCVYARVIG